MLNDLAHFWILRGKYILLRKVGNVVVSLHFHATPRVATEDTLSDIILERLRLASRRIEFKCQSIKEAYEELGKEILRDDQDTQNPATTKEG